MKRGVIVVLCLLSVCWLTDAFSAYHHEGEIDSPQLLAAYEALAGTKLDHCATCHTGGEYVNSKDRLVSLGSCQWCHYSYGYEGTGNIIDTLNDYGKDYLVNGRDVDAVSAIAANDSDGDGYSNQDEIAALTYPGNAQDYPGLVTAPYRVYTKAQLEAMPTHTQFLLMNANRQTDEYTEYAGPTMQFLLGDAGAYPETTGITVFAPDGFSNYYPLVEDADPGLYHVLGEYPQSIWYYSEEADISLNPEDGWCDYSAPANAGRNDLDPIVVPDGLRMILAHTRDGVNMDPGVLTEDNKLDGEGPFRVVPPQKNPGPPDQRFTAENQEVGWPYDDNADHNAGSSIRSATIIRVEPLPEGTTDIDVLEAGWNYVDEGKIIVYGGIAGGDQCPIAMQKADGTLAMPCVDHLGTRYQAYFEPYENPQDTEGRYWRMSSVYYAAAGARNEICASTDAQANLHIPCMLLDGTQQEVTLMFYVNPEDPDSLYWNMSSGS